MDDGLKCTTDEMVWLNLDLDDDGKTYCKVIDVLPNSNHEKISIVVRPSYTIDQVFKIIETQYNYNSFYLALETEETTVLLNDKRNTLLYDVPGFKKTSKNILLIMSSANVEKHSKDSRNAKENNVNMNSSAITNLNTNGSSNGTSNLNSSFIENDDMYPTNLSALTPDSLSDLDLALGASASPTEMDTASVIPLAPALPMYDPKMKDPKIKLKLSSSHKLKCRYVGLVNQAMTCYLNSLLQALFMTPEFRNALYNWEFDGIDEAKSIPYQLQKLFLNLQTSQKVAVETTDLTKSFGWDSTEAWQQHDIQELCRVMFDALEQKFKNTDQADLINRLYEGKMIDYVKCLDCCTEKSREDTFLDIPLPVRPFGSNAAYGSIEEALRAFVQPETLDGNNQYLCEKCNKKCDAHKGLKFKKFPYILTLHLKRFDFDYQTLHRIKLNDKVTFPQTLNLNSFINATDVETFGTTHQINGFISSASSEHDTTESLIKCDDSSTTDSGAVLEEDNCSGIATTASSSHNDNDLQEDDEGIDMSTSTDNRMSTSNESGPYIYELFAIMIHSGSASGGHYYAYIKDFDNCEWYCFNDQTVSPITQEDIQKSFGGGSFKAYYSSIYSSSTNAYMLMYRQLEPKQNATAMKTSEFPEYINKLLQRLDDTEEETRKLKASEPDIVKLKVYFYNPKLKTMKFSKVYTSKACTLDSVLDTAHSLHSVGKFAPLSRCRLVAYDHLGEEILYSLEGHEKEPVDKVCADIDYLLETRGEKEEFEIYEPNGITTRVYKVDLKNNNEVDGPYLIRAIRNSTIESFKKLAARKMKLKWKDLVVAIERYADVAVLPKDDDTDTFYPQRKIFVTCIKKPTLEDCQQFLKVVNSLNHLMYLYVTVPVADKETLQQLAIPPYVPRSQQTNTPKQSPSETSKQLEGGDVVDAVMMNSVADLSSSDASVIGASGDFKRASPLPPVPPVVENGGISIGTNGGGAESNSEDSSLSDGDRTLVESGPHNSSHSSTPSHSPQLSSPDDENEDKALIGCLSRNVSDDEDYFDANNDLYFRAIRLNDSEDPEETNGTLQTNGNVSDSEDRLLSAAESSSNAATKDKVQIEHTFQVLVDNRMRIGTFKRCLESPIQVLSEYFRIVQKQSNDLKHFYLDMSEKLRSFKDGDKLHIELGRNLKKGEHKAKLYYLKLSEIVNEVGKLEPVCERVFNAGALLSELRQELIDHLHMLDSKYHTLTTDNCRLWERSGKNPLRILPAGNKLAVSDLGLSTSCEVVLQECENVSPTTGAESLTLFVRRWHPSTLELDPFREITLEKDIDIRKLLSDISDIPEENIAFSRVNSSFPATDISLLNINSSMSWFTNAATIENYPIYLSHSGSVYFYKNCTESPKELNAEDRREMQAKEKARLERVGAFTTSAYSPRRERALKIYLDTSPKSRGD